jgi:hypothetical protein
MHCDEHFTDHTLVTGPATLADFLDTTQPLHSLTVPRQFFDRYIWIAAGAYAQSDVNANWFVLGRLDFFRQGQKQGSVLFSDASSVTTPTQRAEAKRAVVRLRADSSGSVQPALRYQITSQPAWTRDNLDIGCFHFRSDCDRIEYWVEDSYYTIPAAAGLGVFTGMRVLSVPII